MGGEWGEQEGKMRKFRGMQRQNRGAMVREAEWEELEENNRERWGGTGYATFLLQVIKAKANMTKPMKMKIERK